MLEEIKRLIINLEAESRSLDIESRISDEVYKVRRQAVQAHLRDLERVIEHAKEVKDD